MSDYWVIVQARIGSSRLPGKIARPIQDLPMLSHQLRRLAAAGLRNVCVATTNLGADDATEQIARETGVRVSRGHPTNLMARFVGAAKEMNAKVVIRVGADDPLIDPACIFHLTRCHVERPAQMIIASHRKGWIYGTAAELIELETLEKGAMQAILPEEREHIIPFFKGKAWVTQYGAVPSDPRQVRPDILLSVDFQEDFDLVSQIFSHFARVGKPYTFTQDELIALYDSGELAIKNRALHSGFDDFSPLAAGAPNEH